MDGVSIGMMVDKVQREGNLFVPIESGKILDAPEYKERMFIKTKKNRKMIIKACQEGKFPNIKHSLFDQDPGLEHVSTLFEGLKSEGYKGFPLLLSSGRFLHFVTSAVFRVK